MIYEVRSLYYLCMVCYVTCTKEPKETFISNFRQDIRMHRRESFSVQVVKEDTAFT